MSALNGKVVVVVYLVQLFVLFVPVLDRGNEALLCGHLVDHNVKEVKPCNSLDGHEIQHEYATISHRLNKVVFVAMNLELILDQVRNGGGLH